MIPRKSALDAVLRQGAKDLLRAAIQNEVDEYIQAHAALRDEKCHRLVVPEPPAPPQPITAISKLELI